LNILHLYVKDERKNKKRRTQHVPLLPSSGVIRAGCSYMSSWQSYKCFGLNYRMLAIESLDSDTETRRLSPVAVLGDGYLDLINGGWKNGNGSLSK